MHACFHGGGGGGVKTINIIRDLTKNMKAMSLNARARRRRRRGRRSEAEEDPQTSAKIAPAQAQEADGDHDPPTSSGSHQPRKEEQGGKRRVLCDKCYCPLDVGAVEEASSAAADNTAAEESDGEWVAEPEPGVLMTLVSRADGTNQLRKLRFREELFEGPRAAQRWWADNYDFIVELYSLVQPDGSHEDEDGDGDEDEPVTPCQSEDDSHKLRRWQRPGCDSASTSGPSSGSGGGSASTVGSPILGLIVTAPETSSRERGPGPSPISRRRVSFDAQKLERKSCPSILYKPN